MKNGWKNTSHNGFFPNKLIVLRWMTIALLLCVFSGRVASQQKSNEKTAAQNLEVAITVDDLPEHGDLPEGVMRSEIARNMVRTLQAYRVPGVYGFVNAGRIGNDPDLINVLKIWTEAGFLLGSHTYSHPDLTKITARDFEKEIAENEPVLKQWMGARDWHWLRYPFLHEGDTLEKRREVHKYLKQNGYRVAQVTLDFEDYLWNNPYARCVAKNDEKSIAWLKSSYLQTAAEYIALEQKMAAQIYGHDIKHVLVLHIGAFDSVMLPDLLQMLKKQGFHFISLEEAEKDLAYKMDPDAALKFGGTLLDQFFDSRHLKYPPHAEKPIKALSIVCQ